MYWRYLCNFKPGLAMLSSVICLVGHQRAAWYSNIENAICRVTQRDKERESYENNLRRDLVDK